MTLETTQLAHEDHGTGVPVVLLHAFPLDRRLWSPQVPELSRACWLILPDCPGFGGTPSLPDGASIEDYAGLVVGLLDRLGVETAVVGGLSMGGYVTCALARLYPERLRAVILADTKAGEDSPQVKEGREATAASVLREGPGPLAEQMLDKLLPPSLPGRDIFSDEVQAMMLAASPEGIAAASRAMARRPDSLEALSRLDCPALVLVGEDDALTPPTEAERMATAMPRARLVRIPHAGHLSNLDQPQAFGKAVLEFLREQG